MVRASMLGGEAEVKVASRCRDALGRQEADEPERLEAQKVVALPRLALVHTEARRERGPHLVLEDERAPRHPLAHFGKVLGPVLVRHQQHGRVGRCKR